MTEVKEEDENYESGEWCGESCEAFGARIVVGAMRG